MDDAAEVVAICAIFCKKPNATDLLVISHGWNNDMNDARKLYAKFLACLRHVLDEKAVCRAGGAILRRDGGAVAVDQVRGRRSDSERRRGCRLGRHAALVKKQLDRLERPRSDAAGKSKIKSARALVPALANDPKAREKFADLIRSALPKRRRRRRRRSKAFFKRKGGDLMDRLSKPVTTFRRPGRRGAGRPQSVECPDGAAGGIGDTFSGVLSGARNLLNYSTYYLMKERAGNGRPWQASTACCAT